MVEDEEYSKKVKRLLWLCIVGAILGVVGILLADVERGYESIKMVMAIVDGIILVVLLVLAYIFSKKKKLAGPILGIILGALDIIHLSVYGIIVGIYIIVHCASMCKDISASKKNKEEA
ncbi:MAG: hypothetical protein K2H53_06630 [Clostridia bacterium]|nr:hypothetical protein [Clostridia bacterium]